MSKLCVVLNRHAFVVLRVQHCISCAVGMCLAPLSVESSGLYVRVARPLLKSGTGANAAMRTLVQNRHSKRAGAQREKKPRGSF